MLCPELCVFIERVKEPQQVYIRGRRLSLFLLLEHISAGSSVYQFVSGCKGVAGSWELGTPWLELWLVSGLTCASRALCCVRDADTSSDGSSGSVKESFRLKHWLVINLQPAGLRFKEKIAVLEMRILTPREQETSDRGDVLASETNLELGRLLYVLQGSAGVQVNDA